MATSMFWFKFKDRVLCVLKLGALQESPGSFQVRTSCVTVGSVSRVSDSAAVIPATPGCTAAVVVVRVEAWETETGNSCEGASLGCSKR